MRIFHAEACRCKCTCVIAISAWKSELGIIYVVLAVESAPFRKSRTAA